MMSWRLATLLVVAILPLAQLAAVDIDIEPAVENAIIEPVANVIIEPAENTIIEPIETIDDTIITADETVPETIDETVPETLDETVPDTITEVELEPVEDLTVVDVSDGEDDSTLDQAVTAALEHLTPGTTVAALEATTPASIECRLTIENLSKYPLVNTNTAITHGSISIAPETVLPGFVEAVHAAKTAWYTTTGTSGVASFEMNPLHLTAPIRVHVMWSVPYSHMFYSNYIAVGITSETTDFDTMYNGFGEWFQRAECAAAPGFVEKCNDLFCVRATVVDSSYKAAATVQIIPMHTNNIFTITN